MSYITDHKTRMTFETYPEPCMDDKDATIIHVSYVDDIALDESSEEYRETMRELSINITRTLFLTMVEKGVFTPDELALVLAEKVYLPLKGDLTALGGSSRLEGGVTLKEIVLDEEEEDDDDQ